MPILILSVYPAFAIAIFNNSSPAKLIYMPYKIIHNIFSHVVVKWNLHITKFFQVSSPWYNEKFSSPQQGNI